MKFAQTSHPALLVSLLVGHLACSGSIGESGSEEKKQGGATGGSGGGGGGSAGNTPAQSGPCELELPLRRLTEGQYRNSVRAIFGGKVSPSGKFPLGELGSSNTGFSTEPAVNEVTKLGAESVMGSAEDVAIEAMNKIGTLVDCAADANEACARKFIGTYARRAYRRPLTMEEEGNLVSIYRGGADTDDPFKIGIGMVAWTMLQSPQFLYIIESGRPTAVDDVVSLNGYEVASRLSFLLWDSSPDDNLLEAAEAGALEAAGDIRAQAERLLGDERAHVALSRFAREWTELGVVTEKDRLPPEFTDALADAQRTELDVFVRDAFLSGKSIDHLLSTRETFVDRRMAELYGLNTDGRENGVFEPVTLDASRGHSGLLTMPAIMASRAHSDAPAYVFRGTFALEKVMCVELPLPPAGAAQMLPDFPANATQRQKSDLIQGVGTCAACHNMIDPLGHSFEGFDEIGRARTQWPDGHAVDTSGAVFGVDDEIDGAYGSPVELGQRLGQSDRGSRCVAQQLFRFSFSRANEEADACAIDQLLTRYKDAGGDLREMLLATVESDSFRTRRLAGGQ